MLGLAQACSCQPDCPCLPCRDSPGPQDSPGDSTGDSMPSDTGPEQDQAITPQTFIDGAGLYGLLPVDEPGDSETAAQFLEHSDYAGISVRSTWSTLEPSEGELDWRAFDDLIAIAQGYDKRVILRVKAGWCSPDWVYEAGAEAFEYAEIQNHDQPSRMPAPWDPVFQNKWSAFLEQLGERYDEHPDVFMVIITGASRSTEMYLPNSETDQEQWAVQGYDPELLVASWTWLIDQYATHLPQTPWGLGLSKPLHDDGVTEAVASYGVQQHPWQFMAKINYWQDDNDEAYFPTAALLSIADERTHGGLEPVGWFGDGRPAGDVELATDAALRWHTVTWNEPYIGNIDEHGRLAEEVELHRQLVAGASLEATVNKDGDVQLEWTAPSEVEGFEEVLLMRKEGDCPDGSADSDADEIYRGTDTSHTDEGAATLGAICYGLYALPWEYTVGQGWVLVE